MTQQQPPRGAGQTARATPAGTARVIKVVASETDRAPHPLASPVRRPEPAPAPGITSAPIEVPPPTVDRDYSAVVPATPRTPAPPRPTRALLLVGLAAVALVATVTMAVIFALSANDPESAASGGLVATPGASAGSPPTGQASVAPSAEVTDQPAASSAPPITPLDPAGSGSDALIPGLTAAAAVVRGDVVEVSESVYWPSGAPDTIVLTLPPLTLNGVPAGVTPRIRALQVSVDGTPVVPVPGGDANTWTVGWPGARPERMELRYLVDGALVRSTPSQPGRALGVIAPLSQGSVGDLPVQVRLAGQGVLGVACATSANTAPELCGRQDGDEWTATVGPAERVVVVAQLDLPTS